MSGIAVIYNLDGRPADPSLLERMLAVIPYRGPDGSDCWVDGPIAIGHAMLHTTPESLNEHQPMRDGGLCLTFDGRIDNREDLKAAAESAGAAIKSDTDAELVLRAYQVWGLDSPKKLLGDFAYALWDSRERRLLCARDPMSVKPFYYYCDGRIFVCGSELHQILEHPQVRREPNEGMIGEYFIGTIASREETLFKGVMRLAGGDSLIVRPEGISKRRWFDLDPRKQIRYRTDDEYAEHLRDLIEAAVRCRMRSTGGMACQLSGGLDSSSVVGVAQTLMREGRAPTTPFETFSMWFSHPESDEREYINDVAQMWQVPVNPVVPPVCSMESCIAQVLDYKEPPLHPTGEMMAPMMALIASKGFRVCLTGFGGDEWHAGGMYRHADLVRQFRLGSLIERLRSDARLVELDRVRGHNHLRSVVKYGFWPLVPEPVRELIKSTLGRYPFPEWLEPGFIRKTRLTSRIRQRTPSRRFLSLAQQEIYHFLTSPSTVVSLEAMERLASRVGFDMRHPLHDLRLVEFAIATPDEQRRRGVVEKFAFRGAMRAVLPDSVLNRCDKGDFTNVAIAALENLGGAKLFEAPVISSLGWANAERLRKAYGEMMEFYRNGDIHYAAHTWSLFGAFGVEIWFNYMFRSAINVGVAQRLAGEERRGAA